MIILILLIFGLLIGSFLNVVIYRLPIMLKNQWQRDCHEYLQITAENDNKAFNLAWPSSHCPNCHHKLKIWQNIPIVSFLLLKRKCAHCQQKIAWQYPIVEIISPLLVLFCFFAFGLTPVFFAASVFALFLLVLTMIDLQHELLPDILTLSLLWLGLLSNSFHLFTSLNSAIYAAVIGYGSLWLINKIFSLIRHKQAMGYGDFKLFAALGAWFGISSLLFIILLASVVGLIVGIMMIIFRKHHFHKPLPFGPYLALAGIIYLLCHQQIQLFINQFLLG